MGNFIPNTNNTTLDLSEMKQIRTRTNYLENEINKLKKSNTDLINKNNSLKKELDLQSSKNQNHFTLKNKGDLKKFVNEWYNKNADNIDIGVIDLPFGGSIDILPDSVEKHLYVKVLSLLMEIIAESKIELMGQEISVNFKQ